MGCFSSNPFVVDEYRLGCNKMSFQFLKTLFLTKNDLDILMTAFCDIDADGSDTIRFDEFMTYFRIDRSKFNEAVFGLLDNTVDGQKYMTFLDFVVVMYVMSACLF
jgi:Ca2+-binding EF-hand superfamily protein